MVIRAVALPDYPDQLSFPSRRQHRRQAGYIIQGQIHTLAPITVIGRRWSKNKSAPSNAHSKSCAPP
jgi:hypothetical protein